MSKYIELGARASVDSGIQAGKKVTVKASQETKEVRKDGHTDHKSGA